MKPGFDFKNVGKREPYTVPYGFFDTLPNTIVNRIEHETPRRVSPWRTWLTGVASVAAVASVLIIVAIGFPQKNIAATRSYSFEDVERSFDVLSETDRDIFIDTYRYDTFINEQTDYDETDF